MPSKSIYLLAALTLIILLAALYLGYELTETRRENQALVQQLLQARQQGGSDKVNESYPQGACQKHYCQACWIDSGMLSIND